MPLTLRMKLKYVSISCTSGTRQCLKCISEKDCDVKDTYNSAPTSTSKISLI